MRGDEDKVPANRRFCRECETLISMRYNYCPWCGEEQ